MGAKLPGIKEMTPDGNSNPQKPMKRNENVSKKPSITNSIYSFSPLSFLLRHKII